MEPPSDAEIAGVNNCALFVYNFKKSRLANNVQVKIVTENDTAHMDMTEK